MVFRLRACGLNDNDFLFCIFKDGCLGISGGGKKKNCADLTCRVVENPCQARRSGRSLQSHLEMVLVRREIKMYSIVVEKNRRRTGAKEEYADVVYRAHVGQFKVGMSVVHLDEVCL